VYCVKTPKSTAFRKLCSLSDKIYGKGEVIAPIKIYGKVIIWAVIYAEEKPPDLVAGIRAWEQEIQVKPESGDIPVPEFAGKVFHEGVDAVGHWMDLHEVFK